MRVMGIDPAMNNCGYCMAEVSEESFVGDAKYPTWWKKPIGIPNFGQIGIQGLTVSGPFKANAAKHIRVKRQFTQFLEHYNRFKPNVLVFEAQLDVGISKSVTGVALQFLLTAPFIETTQSDYTLLGDHLPEYVILIRPERLQSLAHNEKTTHESTVITRASEVWPTKGFAVDHIADAAFLTYFGTRFVKVCLEKKWAPNVLSSQELSVFLTSPKPMSKYEDSNWWSPKKVLSR